MLTLVKNAFFDRLIIRPLLKTGVASILISIPVGTSTWALDPNCVSRADWTTLPSTYTHDARGNRVDQYADGIAPIANDRADYQRSGFRHTRSTLQAGNSVDNLHIVDKWGGNVQPYGEWRYPYRPYSVPYEAWGPQSPRVNVQQGNPWGTNGYSGAFPGQPGGVWPGYPGVQGANGNGFGVGPNNALRPDQDDYYPAAPEPPPVSDRDFFFVPRSR